MTASNYAVIVGFSGGGEAQRQIYGTLEGKRKLKVKEGIDGVWVWSATIEISMRYGYKAKSIV